MLKFYPKYFHFSVFILSFVLILGTISSKATTPCDAYLDASPLSRATTYGEEQVVNGNYQGVAQQYNNTSGQISSVIFWARVNPASGSANNTLKVVVYSANLALPGVILGSQNVVVDSNSACYAITATFGSPIAVTGSIIISIEPFSPVADNFYIKRNTPPDGQFLNLIKIKQANQWFKNLAAGDPNFDYDFMILPVKSMNLTASFTHSAAGNTTNFLNTSSNATTYLWDFGDGDTSTAVSPSHNYAATATYIVTLKAFVSGLNACMDSVVTSIPVVITGISPVQVTKKNGLVLTSGVVQDYLTLESGSNLTIRILDVLGNQLGKFSLKQNEKQQIKIDFLKPGIYLINSDNNKSIRFIKTK